MGKTIHGFTLALALAGALGAQSITVYPGPANIPKGTTRQMSAYVPLSPNTVTWAVNGVVGGSAKYGTISQTGLYSAPGDVPMDNTVTITVTSTAFPAKFGTAQVNITQPQTYVWSVYPSTFAVGPANFSINGAGFIAGAWITINNQAVPTTFVSPTSLKVTTNIPASMVGTAQIRAVNPGPGSTTSDPVNVTVKMTSVTVSVSPASASVAVGKTLQLTATVGGSANTAVTWSATGGSVSSSGLFTAPASVPSPATITVKATSAADPLVSASAVITVTAAPVTVSVSPASASVTIGATQQFTATVGGSANTGVTWSATAGSISASGLFTAPASVPNPATVTVKATSMADPNVSATASVTIKASAVTVSVSPASVSVQTSATQQFAATVGGTANTAVTWTATGGTISAAGLFTAPASIPSPATVTVKATSAADPTVFAQALVTVTAPPVSAIPVSQGRFLEQAAFGPTTADLAALNQAGNQGWLNAQFALAETPILMPATTSDAQQQYLSRMVHAPDQLRQRMVNALAKIIVISTNKNIYPPEFVPYWQILSKNAFGNYRQLLSDITTSPQMGKYLDLANSNKPGVGGGANENYARELMQLFTVGLVALNPDGTVQIDGQGNPIQTYNHTTVAQTARALTGWTYPTAPGATPQSNNWESFNGPMETRDANHDTTAKTLVGGCAIPAGKTVAVETQMVLDCVFNHPNTGPFVVTRLIRDLVTSNPSPAYVQRVVNVWNAGAKGDLKAVLTAILLDPEARQDNATPNQGRLKDSTYHAISFLRAMNGSLAPVNIRPWEFGQLGMYPMGPPSVFGFYPMLFRIPATQLFGPEFQIYAPTEAMQRGNWLYGLLTTPNGGDMTIDLSPYIAVAGDTTALIETINSRLLYGRMPASMKSSLSTAITASYDNNQRMITALYLTVLSGQYTVQY
ncbi:MAG: DUF1800 family protein [Bryobacteraceae bacterium]